MLPTVEEVRGKVELLAVLKPVVSLLTLLRGNPLVVGVVGADVPGVVGPDPVATAEGLLVVLVVLPNITLD